MTRAFHRSRLVDRSRLVTRNCRICFCFSAERSFHRSRLARSFLAFRAASPSSLITPSLGWCPGTPKASSFSSRIRVVGNVVGGLINGSSESADFGQIGGADAIIGPGTNVSHADTEQCLMNQFGGQIDGE